MRTVWKHYKICVENNFKRNKHLDFKKRTGYYEKKKSGRFKREPKIKNKIISAT